jgi:hypothetical protein
LHCKERLVFERSLELATELGLISGKREQILDSTPMLGAAAVQDTATLVRSGVRKLLDAVKAADPEGAAGRASGLRFEYANPRRKPAGDWQDKAARMELLGEVALDATRALRVVEEDDELIEDERVAAAARLLREIVGQEFALADNELPRPRGGRRSRQIVSAEDAEMRHGRQAAARHYTGYKIHAAADAQAPILTAISLSAANEHDGHHAGALVDQQRTERRPQRVIGDTAYGNIEAREELAERSVAVLAPVHSTSPKDGSIPKDEFRIDLETDTVTCPQGKTTPIYKPRPSGPSKTGTGSPASRGPTANPARFATDAHRAASGISASAAARTCARLRCRRYPIPISTTISTGCDRESSGCSD